MYHSDHYFNRGRVQSNPWLSQRSSFQNDTLSEWLCEWIFSVLNRKPTNEQWREPAGDPVLQRLRGMLHENTDSAFSAR